MFACVNKKPSTFCSAFFIVIVSALSSLLFIGKANAAQQQDAFCESSRLTIQVRRGDLTGTNQTGSSQTVNLNSTKTASLTIGRPIDLNIAADAQTVNNNMVTTETSDWLWRIRSSNGGGFKGYLTAEYEFNGATIGDNKICSTPDSCLIVKNIESVITNLEYKKGSGKLMSAEGRVRLTVDVSEATASGKYASNLSINVYDNWNGNKALINCR